MPTVKLGQSGRTAQLEYGVYGRMQQALQAAGVPDPDGKWVAAMVRASLDDDYLNRIDRVWPRGVAAVFRQFDDRYPDQPADVPAAPQALQNLMPQGPKPAQPRPRPNMLAGLMGSPQSEASGSNPLAALYGR